jgi:hypothetical protein
LPHPKHTDGGFVFPHFAIDAIGRDLTRFDIDFDLPDHFLAEFPPAIYLTPRPDLGDVSQGKLVSMFTIDPCAPASSMPLSWSAREYDLNDSAGGLSMNRLFLKLATTLLVSSVLYSTPGAAQESPTTKKAAIVQITQGPEIERADPDFAIIRWTSNNPGGTPEHYGVVHYGTNPKELSQTAKSPIRLNPDHAETVFRVRMEDLKPGITYYYTVDSMGGDGTRDGVESTVYHFTTPAELKEP